uniref:Aldehyde oxidase/xanthine dehydrogenase second molybdopterin binding domain-containing protein n=3 Tax=Lygus hesperus TaxID=30085 RepID=A0A0K8SXX6_LYGHE
MTGVNMNYSHMWSAADGTKNYDIYGVTVSEVEVDVLTGAFQIVRVDLMEDCGQSMSPEVDIGQAEGAFMMGLGYFTSEEITFDPDTGSMLNHRTWTYKPPGAKDIPQDFRVYFKKNAPNPFGILKSKATGEPPLCMSASVAFAIREAVMAARKEAGKTDEDWVDMDLPFTVERIWLNGLACREMYTI